MKSKTHLRRDFRSGFLLLALVGILAGCATKGTTSATDQVALKKAEQKLDRHDRIRGPAQLN